MTKPKLDKHGFPVEVPYLSAEDMYKGCFVNLSNRDCRCLAGHWNYVTTGSPGRDGDVDVCVAFERAVFKATREVLQCRGSSLCSVPYVNDNICITNEERAKVWNRAMELLGYEWVEK